MVGQSNMGGYGDELDVSEPFDAPQPDVLIWQDDLNQNVGWAALRPGFGGDSNNGSGGDGTQFGPEVAFGRSLEDELPGASFALIKHGEAGPGATMEDGWNPSRDNGAGPGHIWTNFVNKVDSALAEFEATQTTFEIAGLVVAQGSRDMVSETGVEAEEYEQNFTNFIAAVRQTYSVPELPVILAKSSPFRLGTEHHEGAVLVRNAQEAVAAADPLAFMVTIDDLPTIDGVHLDTEGQLEFGDRFADAYRRQPTYGSAIFARDGFESGDFSGGTEQWAVGYWNASGDSSVTMSDSPHGGSAHALLRRGSGELIRTIDASNVTDLKLRFWSRLDSFEGSDRAQVRVSSDGLNWQVVREFVDGDDDRHYRFHQLDLPDLGDTIHVQFDAQMNRRNDVWYLDDISIVGAPSGPPSQAPSITSSPVTTATEDLIYSYDVDASDPDTGDTLTFSLDLGANGMVIDANTGLIQWTPNNADVMDPIPVTVRVEDQTDAFATQSFNISVTNVNDAPVITSTPVTSGTEGVAYTNDVDADDPDAGDTAVYSLDKSPTGMTIDANTGVISWTPQTADVGAANDVTVRVTDGQGESDTQSFAINVSAPSANVIFVSDISFDSKRRARDWRAVFEVRDQDNIPISSVQIEVTFAGNIFTGTTDSNGIFRTSWIRNLSSGNHYAEAADLAFANHDWDQDLGWSEDYDGDGLPDALLEN